MHSVAGPLIIPDLATVALGSNLKWEPFRPGIEIVRLCPADTGEASAFLRYAPGAKLQRHTHRGWEHILVLSGSQIDEAGCHHAGALLVHPPGSSHSVSSDEGCIVLAIWEKPVTFIPEIESQPIMTSVR
jgi:anti-sigma factor ChrR (cupin superfamily)